MEESPRSFKKIKLAEEEMGSGGQKFGLAECSEIDRQLAQVASADFGDIYVGLLDEIFQCVYFSDLLSNRR